MIDITEQRKGAFWTALHEAQPGDNIVYARGVSCAGPHRQDAMKAHTDGLVALVQKRHGIGDFSHIAQKNRAGRKP